MDSADETIIKLNKIKIGLLTLGAFAFVAAGVWMLSLGAAAIRSERSFASFFNTPAYVYGLGLASVLLFGPLGLYGLKALFDQRPALVLNESGIVDNASAISAGFIPWSEIRGAGVLEIEKQRMLVIEVSDPRKYIDRGGSLRRLLNRANHGVGGSPIYIPSITLGIDFRELVTLFNRYQRKYGDGYEAVCAGPEAEPGASLLDWSPLAVKVTVGAGGVGILVLLASSLDLLFRIKMPFWGAATVSMLPAVVFFVAAADLLPARVVRPARRFAAVWYLASAALSVALAAARGLEGIEFLLIGFVLLGAWPCLRAVRGMRASRAA